MRIIIIIIKYNSLFIFSAASVRGTRLPIRDICIYIRTYATLLTGSFSVYLLDAPIVYVRMRLCVRGGVGVLVILGNACVGRRLKIRKYISSGYLLL